MNSVVQQRKKKSKTKSDRLNKLWRKAQRLQDENARLRERLDTLLDRVRRELATGQAEEAEAARELILHLLPFLRRKSLTNWQRDEIRRWVEEQLEIVIAAGLMDKTLADALARDWALRTGIEIDEDSDRSAAEQVEAQAGREQETEDAAFEDMKAQAEADIEAWVKQEVEARVRAQFGSSRGRSRKAAVDDLFAAELDEAERERAEAIERFRRQAEQEVREQIEAGVEELFSSFQGQESDAADGGWDGAGEAPAAAPALERGVLERLFRRTANVLHPDKEQDDSRRADKQALMGSLLEARKNEDVLTLVSLYQEHVGGSPEIEAGDEKGLLAALEQQIEDLEDEKEAIINQSPAHANVYEDFYGRSRKQVDREIAELKEQARERAERARGCVREVRTLKALKPELEERREDRFLSMRFGVFVDDL